jgi:hypothetical protein
MIARTHCRGHHPRSFTGSDNRDVVTRQTIDDTVSERTADEAEWVDTGNPRTKNLMQVSA